MLQRLSDLKVGKRATIYSIEIQNKHIKHHLLDMGVTIGTSITIKKVAPSGDPVDIEIRGYELCVRKKELSQIIVEA